MSQIVNLTEIINKNKQLSDIEQVQQASEIVLDSIEEQFDGGILIGVLGNKLQMSSTMEDEMEIIQLLEEALENLYKEINYD